MNILRSEYVAVMTFAILDSFLTVPCVLLVLKVIVHKLTELNEIVYYYLGKKFSDTYGLWYVFPPHVLKTHVPDCFWLFLYSY